jgi:hypothetical protein
VKKSFGISPSVPNKINLDRFSTIKLALLAQGPATSRDLAKVTGLSLPVVREEMALARRQNLVVEFGKRRGVVGGSSGDSSHRELLWKLRST